MSIPKDAKERQDRARDLRIAGWTFPQIAESLDPTAPPDEPRPLYASGEGARRAVLAANRRHDGEFPDEDGKPVTVSASERRALAGDQLQELIKAWMPAAQAGDKDAAKIVRDCARDYAALYGLVMKPANAPAEHKPPAPKRPGEDPADEVARKRARRLASNGGADPADPAPPE